MFGGYVGLSLLVGLVGVVATVYYKSYYGTVFSCHLVNLDLTGINTNINNNKKSSNFSDSG